MRERDRELLTEVSGWMCAESPQTPRLLLRPFREADFPDVCAYMLQPELQRLSGNDPMRTEAEAREVFDWFLAENRSHAPLYFAIVYRETSAVIGNFSFAVYPFLETRSDARDSRGVSLAFVLHEQYQRRGLMTELLRRMLEFYLAEHDLEFVNAGYFAFNEGSKRLLEKCGMRYWFEHVYPRGDIPTVEMILWREDDSQ